MKIRSLLILLAAAVILPNCTGREAAESRTIQQIQEAEGIPVMITEIKPQSFAINYNYAANLSGIRETTVTSSIADRADEVLVKVGDFVEKDQLLLTFPEDNPMGQYRQAKAVYENSLANYERMKGLFESGAISRSDLEQLETGLTINKANYEAAAKAIKVKAPFAGYVTTVYVRETESVGMGDHLVTITVLDKYKTKVWVPENELTDIKVGSQAKASLSGKTLSGRVVQVAQSMDMSRQAFTVDLEFDNVERLNTSGLLANIEITAYKNENAIVLPRQYIHHPGQDNSFVYVAEDNKAVRRDIVTGKSDGLRFEVLEGLSASERLITQGTNSVTDISLISIIGD